MKLGSIHCGPASVNTYFLTDENTNETVIIDPGEAAPVAAYIDSNVLLPKVILLTHGHFDHMIGCCSLADRYGIPVYIHKDDSKMLAYPNEYVSPFYLPFSIDAVKDPMLLNGGDKLELAGFSIRVLHTPGHTPGGVCYVIDSEKLVFCGDTVFLGSVGRTDFPYSNSALMFAAIRKKIVPLPEDYVLLPGHGPETTVGFEVSNNPFFKLMQ